MLSPPIHEHSIFLHLFRSPLICFYSILLFHHIMSNTCCMSLIPTSFFVRQLNTIFLILVSTCSLLVCRNTISFCMFILYPATLTHLVVLGDCFCVSELLQIFIFILSACKQQFCLLFPYVWMYFLVLPHCTGQKLLALY